MLLAASFRTAFRHGSDLEARSNMMLAATFAGMGFGNSGVHIPHANAYPIAGMVKDFRPPGYPQAEPMVPHGHVGVADRPGSVPVQLPQRAGTPICRPPPCWRRTRTR